MSRESDSSSSGARGGGGTAYPSGTPPYGSRQYPSLNPTQQAPQDGADEAEARAAALPEEPRTETTLTTRIKINIPGSRPIPPVVMRKPVGEEGASGAGSGADEERSGGTARRDATLDMGGRGRRESSAPAAEPEGGDSTERTSDWFAPRKQVRPARPAMADQLTGRSGGPDAAASARSGAAEPETTQQFPAPSPPEAPGHRADLPYFGDDPTPTGPTAITPDLGFGASPAAGHGRDDEPGGAGHDYGLPDGGYGGGLGDAGAGDPHGGYRDTHSGAGDPGAGYGGYGGDPGAGFAPDGPSATTGEHLLDPFGPGPGSPYGPTTTGTGEMPVPPGDLFGDRHPGPATGTPPVPGGPAPTPPHGSPVLGGQGTAPEEPVGRTVGPNLFRDDPLPDRGGASSHVSGDTLVGGIPPVPPTDRKKKTGAGQGAGSGSGSRGAGAGARSGGGSGKGPRSGSGSGSGSKSSPFPTFEGDPSALDALTAASNSAPPSPPAAAPAAKPAGKPARKGRNKLVLLGAALVGVVGVAYAAGLVMNHADVPNGTTVLGVDIGGSSKEEAVEKLDSRLGKRAQAPLKVTVDGEQHELKPSVAGLSLDTEGTVRDVAGRDYNPVNVIGSLFGGTRTGGDPVVVDEEKLSDALERLAGESGTAREGTIKFVAGKAEPVYGRPGKGLDVAKAVAAVSAAYRDRAETGQDRAVELPVVTRQPKVGRAEVERAMKEFAEPALSGWVYVRAAGLEVPFSEQSIGELLSMKPGADGTLQPVIDTELLKEKYGHMYDQVVIEGGAGDVPLSPQHAAAAMVEALRKTAPAPPEKRVATVQGAKLAS
ncbi:hypothetical protein [Streptomyces pactum]|uniref:hypothetical protein n=1 Tax=Streptomyces pactum TaxID=68249 RepID=UPI0036FAF7B4